MTRILMFRSLILTTVIAAMILCLMLAGGDNGYAQLSSSPICPGDIFAVQNKGDTTIALFDQYTTPETDRHHFGLIWKCQGNSFKIIHSRPGVGVIVENISRYEMEDLKFYRVNCSWALRQQALDYASTWIGAKYDYNLVNSVKEQALHIWLSEGELRRLSSSEFSYSENDRLICTELVDIAYDSVGIHLITPGGLPLPCGFRQAEIDGKLRVLQHGY